MFGFTRKKAEVLAHWYSLVPDFQCSSDEFYAEIERELKVRQLPGLEVSRVDFAEGGLLSAKRTYLRLIRERLTFDVCAAPFGTYYFFSVRFAEIPAVVKFWELLVFLVGLVLVFGLLVWLLRFFFGFLVFVGGLGFFIYVARNAIGLGLQDLDTALIRTPVIGPIYERFLRKETYYREDTRIMYHTAVSEMVIRRVEEVTAAKGVKLLREYSNDPILGDLYKKRSVKLDEKDEFGDPKSRVA